ncbi:MAG TPA: sigma-70 family RNA polymerase sigma factor [Terriglobales bacterium]|jgi:RNA polymerase sigma-70 factor (ECF subfamily)|nr:sigma-70 family RNA polymerase sigma factor [Terriglobales bacterium]
MDDNEDLRLVQESRQGSRESFERLISRYEKAIFNAAYRILRDYEDAKDVTQNVFLKAFQNLEHFDAKRRFFSWIYRIALNESINLCKSRRRLEAVEDTRVEENTPEKLMRRTELGGVVQAALMSLGFEYRVVIVLRHFNDCNYQEMSEILEIPEKTVKSRLFTARALLRNSLAKKGIL